MTSQQFLVCDSSSLANFNSWASAISDFIRTAGWVNTSDTGQLNGAGAGAWSGVTTVPGSGLFYYEIFQPGDALTPFFMKLEYGNSPGATNSPTLRITLGTSTNGAGTLTGFVTTATVFAGQSFTAPSATTTFECDFSGTNNRLSVLLWRGGTNSCAQTFAVQRSLNSSGTPTGTYATVWAGGLATAGTAAGFSGYQQSLHFTLGPAPVLPNRTQSVTQFSGWPSMGGNFSLSSSSAFNGSIPVSNPQPSVGFWDYPCTAVALAWGADIVEGVPFTITNQYGQSVTYMPTKSPPLNFISQYSSASNSGLMACCVEFD